MAYTSNSCPVDRFFHLSCGSVFSKVNMGRLVASPIKALLACLSVLLDSLVDRFTVVLHSLFLDDGFDSAP